MSVSIFTGKDGSPPAEQLTVLIPAYNEEAALAATLQGLRAEPALRGARIIVIDDGSRDATARVASEQGATVLCNRTNRGYGAALKRGALAADTGLVAWFDADGQHRAADLAGMLERMAAEDADVVIGARTRASHAVRRRGPGKALLKLAAQVAAGAKIPDINCGLRLFRRVLLARYLHLLPDGFSASTTSTLVFLKRKYRVAFHPVQVRERTGTSTVKQLRDGLRTLHTILRTLVLFSALRAFGTLAALLVLLGLGYGVPVALLQGLGFPVLGELLVVLGVQVFCLGVICDQITALRMERLESAGAVRPDAAPGQDMQRAA